jgi:hypothetical protein
LANHLHPHLRFRQQTLQNQIWHSVRPYGPYFLCDQPYFCCFIEFTSCFRYLYVLDNNSSCWPMARNWKATSAFCVADSLFSDILWICKIWSVVQNISSHLSCITQKQ